MSSPSERSSNVIVMGVKQDAVEALVATGRERGYLTVDEILEAIEAEAVPAALDARLRSDGII
ncbi:MAG: RNA polymerase sigma factor region1.1 domain-containing protein, partial [Nitriliruptorales bacterium]|nr:RNA polymerase sigma factor region1.1 domain-containing protein [Nitriliruptorales bacterium]